MTGATLTYDTRDALDTIRQAARAMDNPAPMWRSMGEYLMIAHDQRWMTQTSPDGQPWQALSPAYQRRKRKNANKILALDGYLKNTLRYQVDDGGLQFGSNRVYAAIHHFGGEIDIAARSQQLYFHRGRSGEVSNRFVSRRQSNFAQRVTLGAYSIRIPARPWLGTSAEDDAELTQIALDYLRRSAFR